MGKTKKSKGQKFSGDKAPIFTFCMQFKNAMETMALRSLYGHNKYPEDKDWRNFERVTNPDYEYGNAMFRHAMGIGEDSEEDHYVASAWNAICKLECYLLQKNLDK